MRGLSWGQRGYAILAGLILAAAATAATAPPPRGIPAMTVAPGARRVYAQLRQVSDAAAKKGMYDCCLTDACEFCASHMAMCPCGKNLAAGKPVCRECKGGWEVGEGRVAGVNPADVKGMSTAQTMAMMKSMGGHTRMRRTR